MASALDIRNLHVSVEDKPILKGVNLVVKQGEIHALMGPNGTGKSTLAYTLMGHPNYKVTAGQIIFKGVDLLELEPDERAHLQGHRRGIERDAEPGEVLGLVRKMVGE